MTTFERSDRWKLLQTYLDGNTCYFLETTRSLQSFLYSIKAALSILHHIVHIFPKTQLSLFDQNTEISIITSHYR